MDSSKNNIYQPFLENNGNSNLSPQLSETHNFESSNELETVLLNTEIPLWNKLRLATCIEMKLLFHFELIAASLGNTGIHIF